MVKKHKYEHDDEAEQQTTSKDEEGERARGVLSHGQATCKAASLYTAEGV